MICRCNGGSTLLPSNGTAYEKEDKARDLVQPGGVALLSGNLDRSNPRNRSPLYGSDALSPANLRKWYERPVPEGGQQCALQVELVGASRLQ